MKPDEYIHAVVSKITDTVLRERMFEELQEHWEDYREEPGQPDVPRNVFGDATLLARQINAVGKPRTFGLDVMVSVCAGVVTLTCTLVLSFLVQFVTDSGEVARTSVASVAFVLGILFWMGLAWAMYFVLHRHLLVHYGQSMLRRLLLAITILVPSALVIIVTLMTITNGVTAGYPDALSWGAFAPLLSIGLLLGVYAFAGRVVARNLAAADRIVRFLRAIVPIIVALAVTLGVVLLVTADNWGTETSALHVVGLPFTFPLLALYMLWGMVTMLLGAVLHAAGVPSVYAFWLTVTGALLVAGIRPVARGILRKPVGFAMRVMASVVVPLVFALPFIPHDVPTVTWDVPVVWSWDMLERRQLNIAYPWAAALMRRDEGMNVSYFAAVVDNAIVASQTTGKEYRVTRGGAHGEGWAPDVEEMDYGVDYYGDLPEGFSCDGTALEDIADTHDGSTGPLGMFGMSCGELTYHGVRIATLSYGGLIDLDLAPDGLLAISIQMGSYDPTYVYVVDVEALTR